MPWPGEGAAERGPWRWEVRVLVRTAGGTLKDLSGQGRREVGGSWHHLAGQGAGLCAGQRGCGRAAAGTHSGAQRARGRHSEKVSPLTETLL